MNWFYVNEGQSTGPVDETSFHDMVRRGVITPETLVWRAGMKEWQPYRDAVPVAEPAPTREAKPCSMCGKTLPAADLVQFEDAFICADCKPAFVQHLKHGSIQVGAAVYAGFWIRFAATFIDGIILGIFNFFVSMTAGVGVATVEAEASRVGLMIGMYLIQLGVQAAYEILMVAKYGATLGKMACKIRVVTAEGAPVTFARSIGRHFAKYISMIILYVGYIMAGFDREKRGLHDYICSTRVIRAP